jgi:carbon monoxide dehydrogenase subunit G
MQLTGSHVLNATPQKVWTMLMDHTVLANIVPGVTRLEPSGDNAYVSVLEIKMGPVSGAFKGNLQLEDLVEERGFTLKAQQNSSIGNANASIIIKIAPVGDTQTQIDFDGDAKISGLLARMGQRVLSGVANTLTKQFFTNFEGQL